MCAAIGLLRRLHLLPSAAPTPAGDRSGALTFSTAAKSGLIALLEDM